jgi:lipopolysaccharide/colanic/teichoic acid biosynthesis glycosyltransferase
VRPGLTGAQVSYSYGAIVEDAYRKLEYELFFLNLSILFDCSIILRTCRILLMVRAVGRLAIASVDGHCARNLAIC